MSKEFNNHFDEVEMSENFKQNTLDRISQTHGHYAKKHDGQSTTRPSWYKRPRLLTKVLAIVLVFAIVLPLVIILPLNSNSYSIPSVRSPIAGANYAFAVRDEAHLTSLLNIENQRPSRPRNRRSFGCASENLGGAPDDMNTGEGGNANSQPPGSSGYTSTTNVQVEGMDEGDIVRNDGRFIYRLSPKGLTIVETAATGQINYIATIRYQNFAPIEMFTRDNLMVVIGGTRQTAPNPNGNSFSHWQWYNSWHNRTQIRIYDITNPADPVLLRFFEIDGQFNTSRIRLETNTLFFVVDFHVNGWNWCPVRRINYRASNRPYFRDCETAALKQLPFLNLFYTVQGVRMNSFMLLGSICLNDHEEDALVAGYLSAATLVSMSLNNLYTATTVWGTEGRNNWVDRTHISRFCLDTLHFTGTAVALGTPPSRHAIDEYNGYLRVATTYGAWWQSRNNDVYFASSVQIFDSSLNLVSYITGIAVGETMDSARFNGGFGFISTSPPWLIWDPLYTVDLSDHHNITISEGLETDGINQYLRHIPGTGLAIGIGQDAPPEGAAWQTGIKIELYDMRVGTGEMPVSLTKYTIYGEQTTAEILFNPRALLFMFCEVSKVGYVGFAAEAAAMRSSWSTITFVQGFYLWRIDASGGDAYAGLEFLGESRRERIVRPNAPTPGSAWVWETVYIDLLLPSFSNFDVNHYVFGNNQSWNWTARSEQFNGFIYRAVINQGYLFTVSNGVIAGYCMRTFDRVDEFLG